MPISIKSRREKSLTVRYELRDFKAGKGGMGALIGDLKIWDFWNLDVYSTEGRKEGRVGLSTCAQVQLNPMKAFSVGVEALDIFSNVPKLNRCLQSCFVCKRDFSPLWWRMLLLQHNKVKLVTFKGHKRSDWWPSWSSQSSTAFGQLIKMTKMTELIKLINNS